MHRGLVGAQRRRRARVAFSAMTAAAVLITGCSSSSGGGKTGTGASTSSPAPSGPPIKLMSILDLTGSTATVPDNATGAQIAVDAINKRGGFNGRPLSLEICDTKTDPNGAADCAHQAVSDGVVALVGDESQLEASYLPIIEQAGIANIGEVPLSSAGLNSPTAFPMSSGTTAAFAAQALELYNQGATNISLAAIDVPTASGFAPVINIGLKAKNTSLKTTVLIPSPSPDMSSYVAEATRGGETGIEVLLLTPDAVKFVQALRQAGSTAKVGMITTQPELLIKDLGSSADGILMTSDGKLISQTTDPTVHTFLEEAKADNKPATTRAMDTGWAAVQLFMLAAKQAQSIDAKGILDAMSSLSAADVGVFPPINFTHASTVLPLKRLFNTKVLFAVVKNGQEVPLEGDQFEDAFPGS